MDELSAEEYDRLKRRDREVMDFATLDQAQRQELIAALEAQALRPDPELDREMEGYKP